LSAPVWRRLYRPSLGQRLKRASGPRGHGGRRRRNAS
jgi:hypothetical protein